MGLLVGRAGREAPPVLLDGDGGTQLAHPLVFHAGEVAPDGSLNARGG